MVEVIKQTGKIVSRQGRNYVLEADSGGRISAESDKNWPVGVRVRVLGGVIVAQAGTEQKIKYYQV